MRDPLTLSGAHPKSRTARYRSLATHCARCSDGARRASDPRTSPQLNALRNLFSHANSTK